MNENKVIVLLSGGLDSTAVIGYHRSLGDEVYAISFMYGQKTSNKEIQCCQQVCEHYGVKNHQILDLRFLKNLMVSGLIDENNFLSKDNKLDMYVPFRNSIFLSFGVAWAESIGASQVAIGSHQTGPICPDNSPEYLDAFQKVIELGTLKKPPIQISAPFAKMRKPELIKTAIDLKVPFELTWSCFNSEDLACGKCPNCMDRLRSFKEVGYEDPLKYAPV
jgi:7-cyano-7-deazaguanine synthase